MPKIIDQKKKKQCNITASINNDVAYTFDSYCSEKGKSKTRMIEDLIVERLKKEKIKIKVKPELEIK